jgi:hypothetical protein
MEPPQDDWEAIRNWWRTFGNEALGKRPSRWTMRRGEIGRRLTSELKTYPVGQLLDACRFVVFGRGRTARLLRKPGNNTNLQTVLRHVESYSGNWEAERDQRGLPEAPEWLPLDQREALRQVEAAPTPGDGFRLPRQPAAPAVTAEQAREYPAWVQLHASWLIAAYFDADDPQHFDPGTPERLEAFRWLVSNGGAGLDWTPPEDRPQVAEPVALDVEPPADPRARRVLAILSRGADVVDEAELAAELYPDSAGRTAGVYVRRACAALVEAGWAQAVDGGWTLAPGRGGRAEARPPGPEGAQVLELAAAGGAP